MKKTVLDNLQQYGLRELCRMMGMVALSLAVLACKDDRGHKLFRQLDARDTGLSFSNDISVNDSLNAVVFEYIYNGGGVAVGDVNNDGLPDLFFSGNTVSSRLYLNRGEMHFEDVTKQAGVVTSAWCTGVSFVDINEDGLLDLYVCVAGMLKSDKRRNLFFINTGLDKKGVPHFRESAQPMGLDDDGYSTMSVFFDYDHDNDLDMYLLTYFMEGELRNRIRPIRRNGESENTDRLYRNNGDGTFSNVSREAGILIEGYGLGVSLCDINQDGWTDIYCANDFISNDLLWINNGDGTFTDRAGDYFNHFSNNGMGVDIADFNNDAMEDVVVVDMMPVSNRRQKSMFAFRNNDRIEASEKLGYTPQFIRNTLQLNQGKLADGHIHFSEIGLMAGIYKTDWSWSPLFADFDNDGWKDLLITNGFRKDITDLDYIEDLTSKTQFGTRQTKRMYRMQAMDKLNGVCVPNYLFRNNGDLTFEDCTKAWGLDIPTYSNGAAVADLDGDGDLDIVVNNIDSEAGLFENTLMNKSDTLGPHFLTLRFAQGIPFSSRIGVKVWVFHHGNHQFFEYSPYRGYMSCSSTDISIGLGADTQVDSLLIQWPGGSIQRMGQVPADTIWPISSKDTLLTSKGVSVRSFDRGQKALKFHEITDKALPVVRHEAAPATDVRRTPSLIRSISEQGPVVCAADANGDGRKDIFVGGGAHQAAHLLLQQADETFVISHAFADSIGEDAGAAWIDADMDGDSDLYVVRGGVQWPAGDKAYQDRLYINNGSGSLVADTSRLPAMYTSGSCVVAADFDLDGDADLFVGGRVVPFRYPAAPQSYLLENVNGTFRDVSAKLYQNGVLGMVTDAHWADINQDGRPDLLVVGEWMNITALINTPAGFVNETDKYGLNHTGGWWNCIVAADLDHDGDTDFVLGNYGLNSLYKASVDTPLELYASDYDRNGTFDPVMTYYANDTSYIVHTRNLMMDLIPGFDRRFTSYEAYGKTPFDQAFSLAEIRQSLHLTCQLMASVVLENVDGKAFKIHALPLRAQTAPIYDFAIADLDGDSWPDILAVGNSHDPDRIGGYYDASYGWVLMNKQQLTWEMILPKRSGFTVFGAKRSIATIDNNYTPLWVISENNGALVAFTCRQ